MTKYFDRKIDSAVLFAQPYYPVTCITGPRQSGKTSLCKHLFPDYKYVNLEDLAHRAAATADPIGFMNSYGTNVIIDEVQHVPQLLSVIQVMVDEDRSRRFIITGSSNFSLMTTMTQSLAGRVALFTLLPFSLKEIPEETRKQSIEQLMLNGLYPGVIANGTPHSLFYSNYYNTYVKRDVSDLLKVKNLLHFDTFIRLVAARAGSEFNASAIAKEVGVSSVTISEWLSILTSSYITFQVRPYYANISKRLTKMPKVFFYDTGLLCYLLSINDSNALAMHPLRGAIFENLAMCELFKQGFNTGSEPNINFYREHSGREVDAMVQSNGKYRLYEMKAGQTFQTDYTNNMKYLAPILKDVESTMVIYDGVSIPPIALNIRDL